MTVIVGVLCEDGAVVVADGAATYGLPSGNQMTIRQSTKKLVSIGNTQLFGTSGAVSLHQAFLELITENSKVGGNFKMSTRAEIRELFGIKAYNAFISPACTRSRAFADATHNQGYMSDSSQHSILAFVDKDSKPQLVQVTPTCQVEFADQNLPFVCVGSGQPAADPFMAFLRNVFCDEGKPMTLEDAKFLAYWAVDLTIRVQPGLVAPPIQMMALFKRKGQWVVEELTEDVAAHAEMVRIMEQKMRAHRSLEEQSSEIPAAPAADLAQQ